MFLTSFFILYKIVERIVVVQSDWLSLHCLTTILTAVFSENIPGVQYVLEVILGLHELKIEKVEVHRTVKNLRGRSIRLDIYAVENANNKVLDR